MKKIAALFLIFYVFSCADVDKSSEPENLFSKDKMAAVLTDLYVVEGAISSNKAAYLKTGIKPSSYIYDKHKIDSISFKDNLDFYTDRIEDYLIIIDKVQANLKALHDSLTNRQEIINKEKQKVFPKNQSTNSIKITKKAKTKIKV